jgi:hypothetical protein
MERTDAATRPDVVLHYSEDADISVFAPHVPPTNPEQPAQVWAIEPRYAALYWFPRDCPRVAVWANDAPQQRALENRFATAAARVQFAHARDERWIRSTDLWEYTFDAAAFEPWPDAEGQWITTSTVRPTAIRKLGDLVAEHARAGVDLRFIDELTAVRDQVVTSGLPFSIARWQARRQPRQT